MSFQWATLFIYLHFSCGLVLAKNRNMDACVPKPCGNLIIEYPFWIKGEHPDYCGYPGLMIDCDSGQPLVENMSHYIDKLFYENNSAVLINSQLAGNSDDCPIKKINVSSGLSQFVISPSPLNNELIFFYNCSKTLPPGYLPISSCTNQSYLSNKTFVGLYLNSPSENQEVPDYLPGECSILNAPVLGCNNLGVENYTSLMNAGFLVSWVDANCSLCKESKGVCFSDFMCICPNGEMYPVRCPISGILTTKWQLKTILIVSTTAGALAFILVCSILIIKLQMLRNFLCEHKTQESIKTILEKYGSIAPKKYKYAELKKITNSFRDKLGRGGFGTVYKGTQQDGHLVAVKLLHNSTSTGEDFINEVISIGRTSHVNVVKLIGFCIEGSKQALVYEYMPNGSLDKYIYTDDPKKTLGWEKLYEIAIGIARGLEYLHWGCNTHIVHFDIKPQNILLDEYFHPKIADFGLAKLCPPKESIISIAEMRGTIGFIAPEVFSRSVGVVSTKSDIYSFGMLVLEMVGGRKNFKMSVQNSSQAYFPHWIYDHIIENGEIQICDVTNETEKIARKMALIGLWCTQMIPTNRPSISKVLEMF